MSGPLDDLDDLATRLRPALEACGQHHVLDQIAGFEAADRAQVLSQLEALDLALLAQLRQELREDEAVTALDLAALTPPPMIGVPKTDGDREAYARATEQGESLLRSGKVAAFVVAGGQGTRLGFDGPKGCFPVGPVSGCSLFAWHFAKVVATRRRYQAAIPMLVMTSQANHDATVSYLREHGYFGMPSADVIVFPQGMLPAVDREGRLLLADRSSLALAPDGHGGSLLALRKQGVLDELARRGVEEIFYFQVDNPLVRVLDPAFLGYHRLHGSEMSSKVVAKRSAHEKVGVFAAAGGKLGIVEYSDLPDELATAVGADGQLRFRAGNIAIHVVSCDFARRLTGGGLALPYHRARKAVPYLSASGEVVSPEDKNGVKFETFVFDALPLAKNPLVVETARSEEFSPVKNKDGEDSPVTAKEDMCRLFRSWVEGAGFGVVDSLAELEIAPSYALDAMEFAQRLQQQKLFPGNRLMMA